MYDEIGKKIKILAKVIFWIGVIFSVCLAIIACIALCSMGETFIVWGIIALIGILVIGVLGSWVGTFVLYGYGELIDSNMSINKKMENE